jgi:hypothetical protein
MANGFLNELEAYFEMGDSGDIDDTLSALALQAGVGSAGVVAGKSGNARQFDHIQDVSEGYAANVDFRQNPMVSWTVSFWMKFDTAPGVGGSTWLVEQYDGAGNEGWGVVARGQNNPDDWAIFYHSGAGTEVVGSATPANINTGQWYHVVAGYDATRQKLFIAIDGDYAEGDATNQITTAGTVDFAVGGWFASGSNFCDGVIDEVALWSRALSSSDITKLYAGGTGVFYAAFDDGASAALSGEPPMDVSLSEPVTVFNHHLEVFDHLLATPLDEGTAAITVVYRQVPI